MYIIGRGLYSGQVSFVHIFLGSITSDFHRKVFSRSWCRMNHRIWDFLSNGDSLLCLEPFLYRASSVRWSYGYFLYLIKIFFLLSSHGILSYIGNLIGNIGARQWWMHWMHRWCTHYCERPYHNKDGCFASNHSSYAAETLILGVPQYTDLTRFFPRKGRIKLRTPGSYGGSALQPVESTRKGIGYSSTITTRFLDGVLDSTA